MKEPHSICQQIWKTQQWPRDGKGQFSFQSQRRAMPKNIQTTIQLHSFCKVMLKIFQARLQLPDVQAELEKAEEPDIKLPMSIGS